MPGIAALDVHYGGATPCAAAVVFHDWRSDAVQEERCVSCAAPAEDYEPGALYKRELPALLTALSALSAPPGLAVVDAFVHLGSERRPGLGWRLWEALGRDVPVIGVAKNSYEGAPVDTQVRRGDSDRPLYVTAVGVDEPWARARIAEMHGPFRLPTLLKRVDRLCRSEDGATEQQAD